MNIGEGKIMNWISVKEKMPIDMCDQGRCEYDAVLVYSSTEGPGLYSIALFNRGSWEILGSEGAHGCTGFYGLNSDDITHWMPLPDKPDLCYESA